VGDKPGRKSIFFIDEILCEAGIFWGSDSEAKSHAPFWSTLDSCPTGSSAGMDHRHSSCQHCQQIVNKPGFHKSL